MQLIISQMLMLIFNTCSSRYDAEWPDFPRGWSETQGGHKKTSSEGGSLAWSSVLLYELLPGFQTDPPASSLMCQPMHLRRLKPTKEWLIN